MKHHPFWVEDIPRPTGITSPLPASADVAIVGSGLTGLSAALRLTEGGRSVTVLEQGEISSGASSINGGMVSPDVKGGVRGVHAKYGPEIAKEMWKATVRSVDIVVDHARRYDLDARIVHGGMTALGTRPEHLAAFEAQVAWYREHYGVDWEVIGRGELDRYVGESDVFVSGLHEPEGIGIHPAGLTFGLARAAARIGVSLVDSCRVTGVARESNGFRVTTSKGTLTTGEVIVATNGYTTSEPVAELARRVVPIGSYIIVTEPLPEAEAKAIFPGNSMSYTKRRLLNYMRRTPDDRILIGGRRNLHPGLDLDESAADLHARLVHFWPGLEGKEITHVWGGKLGVPFDLIPHMGQVDGVWYAMGYGGHGVGLSTLLGHDLAGMLLGEDSPSVFTRIRDQGRFYYRGKPWFLTPASVLYRTLDRMGR